MVKRTSIYPRRWMAVLGVLALVATKAEAAAVQIDYRLPTEQRVDTLNLGGVTVTGSNTLLVNSSWGLNVLSGLPFPGTDGSTDASESLTFRFNTGPAQEISLGLLGITAVGNTPPNTVGETLITAFGPTGQSLGTMDLIPSGLRFDISAAFGGQPISSFLVQPKSYGETAFHAIEVGGLSYTPATVPEPSTLALLGLVAVVPAMRRLARASGRLAKRWNATVR